MAWQVNQLLRVEKVVKDFGGLRAINHVSFGIEKGEIRGLIGPNASGKTTLINLIAGVYRVNEGAIYFSERQITGLRPDQIASLGIMRTFQISRIFRNMTVLENMMVPALSQGETMLEAKIRAEELLEFAHLAALKDQPAKHLSGGQAMLLQIVRGFMNERLHLFLMDEPFAGVHQSIKGIILEAIKRMNREKGITFLVISHEMTTISTLCHQVSVLHKGELIAQGTMDAVANDPQVIDAYLGG